MAKRNWRLPAGVDDWLPPAAWSLELTRRRVLDVFCAWGYQYIEPPIIEYLDSLLVGAGADLDLQTLKVVDQKSGRMLGVRADLTSQAVRVDAHSLPVSGVQRLCYAGNVVFANPQAPLDSRVSLKAGAEIFGAASLEADAEVIALMVEVLASAGIEMPVLTLGHMGIYRNLVEPLNLDSADTDLLFEAMQRKADVDIRLLLADSAGREPLAVLAGLIGGREVLDIARCELAAASGGESAAAVQAAIDELDSLAARVAVRCPGVQLRFDLAEVTGYGYHNGAVFSAYQPQVGRALARGGRYDGVGSEFGRHRAATGFDVSLNELVRTSAHPPALWAPWVQADLAVSLAVEVARRREQGEAVVVALAADELAPAHCDRQLAAADGGWQVEPVASNT